MSSSGTAKKHSLDIKVHVHVPALENATLSVEGTLPGAPGTVDKAPKAVIPLTVQPKLVVCTLIFGRQAWRKPTVQLFISAAGGAGFDVRLIGDQPDPSLIAHLPANVQVVKVTWHELVMRLASELHQDASLFAHLQGANGYKSADFKPLTQLLFPEVVADYDFVGVCDNDLLLSSELLTSFNSHAWDFDVSSFEANNHRSHGPLQVHRATYYRREIVPLLRGKFLYILLEVFARAGASKHTSFDEWGWMKGLEESRRKAGEKMPQVSKGLAYTFTHILRYTQPTWLQIEAIWDGEKEKPTLCRFTMSAKGVTKLYDQAGKSSTYCHFQYGKKKPAMGWSSVVSKLKLVKPPFTVLLELGFPISFHGGTSVTKVFQFGDRDQVRKHGLWVETVKRFVKATRLQMPMVHQVLEIGEHVVSAPFCPNKRCVTQREKTAAKAYIIKQELMRMNMGDWLLFLDLDVAVANSDGVSELKELMKSCAFIVQETADTLNTGFLAFKVGSLTRNLVNTWVREVQSIRPIGKWLGDQGPMQMAVLRLAMEERQAKLPSTAIDRCSEIPGKGGHVCWNTFMEKLGLGSNNRTFGQHCLLGNQHRWNMHDSGEYYQAGDLLYHGKSIQTVKTLLPPEFSQLS